MIDILEHFLQEINLHRSPLNRISYNVSSTQASQYLRSMEGESADCDSMLLISLYYGKQTVISEERGNPHPRMELPAQPLEMRSSSRMSNS